MSDTKFTPGPWKVGIPDVDFCGSRDFPHLVVLDYGVGPCAPNVVACRISEANAHLIASAPQMYSALKRIYEQEGWIWVADLLAKANP